MNQEAAKKERLKKANELLKAIGSCGRRFFCHEGEFARFELDARGRCWFVDEYTKKKIYLHRPEWARFKGFHHGGTLKALVLSLRDFICKGESVAAGYFGPWPDFMCGGDVWGYGPAMSLVRENAQKLGIIEHKETP